MLAGWLVFLIAGSGYSHAQIPMERVLSRITVPSEGGLRGLVDIVGFPRTAEQMDVIGGLCERLEKETIARNKQRYGLDESAGLVAGICPHDDYIIAARVYAHVQRYMKAKTVILIGNAHWSEAFGVRNKLIFGDFTYWRGPYSRVKVSSLRNQITGRLDPGSFTVMRALAETEHSLEAMIPFLQYYNRDVEIIPVFIPFMTWENMQRIGGELADTVAELMREKGWKLGVDLAVLCSTDGQHYGDYGWSYYDYHPYGCDADGYKQAVALDNGLVNEYLEGTLKPEKVHRLFASLVDQNDITQYKVTWCGRFAMPFGIHFAGLLAKNAENRTLTGCFLRYGTSLSDPWLPLQQYKLGLTSDTNLHHFVTYIAMGFK